MISIIISVLNEKEIINDLIINTKSVCAGYNAELIVIDGGESSETISSINDKTVICLKAPASRSIQMNKGAECAKGDILLFLHADSKLPASALRSIESQVAKDFAAGAFSLCLDASNVRLRFIAQSATLRSRITKIPYGDQAIFVTRDLFEKSGGYQNIPLMEDIELMKSIKKSHNKVCILKEKFNQKRLKI